MSGRVEEILSWYDTDDAVTLGNLRRILEHGRTGGSGKLVVLPVDQGVEHGPTRSFAANPAGYDPRYHAQLAVDAGCSAHAAPLGAVQRIAKDFAAQLPIILKCNGSDSLFTGPDPVPAVTAGVEDAVRLGCAAVGFTIYPGSAGRNQMYEDLRDLVRDARGAGLPVVVWSYPRGSGVSTEGRTAVDVVAYAAHLACQLGAHVVKVKPPTATVESDAARAALERAGVPLDTLAHRVHHVVQSAFDGHRMVIFSGGAAKETAAVLEENRQTALGGGFGTIMGRNSFQRPHDEAVALLHQVMDIHRTTSGSVPDPGRPGRPGPTSLQVHTTYDPVQGRWHSRIGGTGGFVGASDSKEEAVARGRQEALSLHAEHVIHNQDGTVAHRERPSAGLSPAR